MFKTLFGKLSTTLFIAFLVFLAVIIFTVNWMLNDMEFKKFIAVLIICVILFGLVIGVSIFSSLSRPLRELYNALETFQKSDFSVFVPINSSNASGDEISRLGYIFEQVETRMMLQIQNLESMAKERRELLANISHDLRTPLASMRGYLETILLKEGSIEPEELRYYLGVATKQSERLGRMVEDLFQLTKLEANDLSLNQEAFSINELAQDVVQKFTIDAEKKGIQIGVNFDERLPFVYADISLIERVLENLIGNALRYTNNGGMIRLLLSYKNEKVTVIVSDTGQGMEATEVDKIFDRYYRADRSKSSDSGHAGLGLSISNLIVKLHGGEITVESKLGVGTKFCFDLPIARPDY
ncbi:MAG: sensor histidine kinase [Methylophilaceae bacterium]